EILVLASTDVFGSIEAALSILGEAYDIVYTDNFTGIDYSPYTTIIVGMDGGSISEASVQTIADQAASGKSLIMVGGTNLTSFYTGVQLYLVSHTGQTGWTTSSTPHLIVTDPSHPLSTDLPASDTFINNSASYYMLRVNDPEIEEAAINGDNHPDLFSK
ncbi:MAG: hypothetical protein KAI25_14650, partial [Hyphomicrobiaceae bacterium]|nr:hypothetical protein [Hyphomicrobiaceae bacterium]